MGSIDIWTRRTQRVHGWMGGYERGFVAIGCSTFPTIRRERRERGRTSEVRETDGQIIKREGWKARAFPGEKKGCPAIGSQYFTSTSQLVKTGRKLEVVKRENCA